MMNKEKGNALHLPPEGGSLPLNSKEKESGSLYDLNQQLEAALQGMDMDADQLPREE